MSTYQACGSHDRYILVSRTASVVSDRRGNCDVDSSTLGKTGLKSQLLWPKDSQEGVAMLFLPLGTKLWSFPDLDLVRQATVGRAVTTVRAKGRVVSLLLHLTATL